MSLSVIVMAGDQQVRIPTMRYGHNDSPVRLYLNIQDGHNLREVALSICPESQQVSGEFAMTSNSEISARRDEFHDTEELVARIPVTNGVGESHAAARTDSTHMTEASSDTVEERDGDGQRRTVAAQAYAPRRSPRFSLSTTDVALKSSAAASVATTTENDIIHRGGPESKYSSRSSSARSSPQVATANHTLRSGRKFPAKLPLLPIKADKMIDRVPKTKQKTVPTHSPRITRSGVQRGNSCVRRVLRPRIGGFNGVVITDKGIGYAGKENGKGQEKTAESWTLAAGKPSCLRKPR